MDVGVGEVVGPDRGAVGPGLEVDRDGDLAAGEVDAAGSAAGVDCRQTQTPFMATSRSAGSKTASVVPIEASTRPQLGSLPNTAALKRLLRATLRPTVTASSSLAAPRTVIAISWSAPSASASSCIARSVQARVRASVRSSSEGVMPLAPLASTVTVSLVDMQPSESSRSKETRVAARRAVSRSAALAAASVVRTTSIVASWGASMPAPLAMPPTLQPAPSITTCLETESVVMIAAAASAPPSGSRPAYAASTPASTAARSFASPIRPVEQTTTSSAPMPRWPATCSATAWVVRNPSGPV